MNIKLIRFLSKKLADSRKNSGFLNFARTVALISVIIGSAALIISLAVLGGFEKMLMENAVKFTSHISVISFNRKPLPNAEQNLSKMKANIAEIKSVVPFIQREGLVRSKKSIDGVMIRGIRTDDDITGIKRIMVSGKFGFHDSNAKDMLIGLRLAQKLGVRLNDEVVIYALKEAPDGGVTYPDIDKFRITGIYESGMAIYDDIVVYIPYSTASTVFKMAKNTASGYEIMLYDLAKASKVSDELEDILGYPHFCLTVYDLHSHIFAWIDLQKEPIPLVLGLISIVAVFNIVTILLITVVEKTHSIGILRALGMRNREIMTTFVFQGTAVGLAGTITGCLLGFAVCWLQYNFKIIRLDGDIYFLDTLPINFSLIHYGIVAGTTLVLSFLATLIPSWIATRINPVRAIRFK